MDEQMEISVDKLPIKRLEAIEENGAERFPSDIGYDEKTLSLVRRIDFAWAVEEEEEEEDKKKNKKRQKKSSKESSGPWQWQNMVENLQLARQELSVILDLMNTVEANDAVTVAGMTRPKPLPNEQLSDLAISAATKLQSYRKLGKYLKQSAKALEQQIAREARFYGALIRLQRNWKIKRQRMAPSAPSNEGFTIDLFDSSLHDSTSVLRPSALSIIRIEHNSAGMLTVNLPREACRTFHFGFLGVHSSDRPEGFGKDGKSHPVEIILAENERQLVGDDESVKETHSLLRMVHKSLFAEQVFDIINREAFSQSLGVNVTGIREHYLQMSVAQGVSLFISLVPAARSHHRNDGASTKNSEAISEQGNLTDSMKPADEFELTSEKLGFGFPSQASCQIYLQQIFHEHLFIRSKDQSELGSVPLSTQWTKDVSGLLGHFCSSLAHRVFSNKVLAKLEDVVCKVRFLQLIWHPTWDSRTSSWTIIMNVPPSVNLQASLHAQSLGTDVKNPKSQFRTKVVVNDNSIFVEGECGSNVTNLFKASKGDLSSINSYDCNLPDLPSIVLHQVASQIISWLHEEALEMGINASRDFLCLSFKIEQDETISLVVHVDPEDANGCISWWLLMDGFVEERNLQTNIESRYKKFLGNLSLEVLYSILMDLVSFCGGRRS